MMHQVLYNVQLPSLSIPILEGWIHSVNFRNEFRGVDAQCAFRGMNTQCEFGAVDTQYTIHPHTLNSY